MTREQNQLIKKLRALSPDDIARVHQFLLQLRTPELRAVPGLKAVANGPGTEAAAIESEEAAQPAASEAGRLDVAEAARPLEPGTTTRSDPSEPCAADGNASLLPEGSESCRDVRDNRSPEAEIADAACALWRRRPFQAIDADDLQPIAALFREAAVTRAASRFRFGSR